MTYNILFLGDVVGRPGREAVHKVLPQMRDKFTFIILNGENSASGMGITPKIADEFFAAGVDAITLGNHSFDKREIIPYLDSGKPIVRPHNMAPGVPGRGLLTVERDGIQLAVLNMSGRTFLNGYDDPFRAFNELRANLETPHLLVDFHAEATSEKVAFGWHCDGRATAVYGTHTHVPTADARILPGGTGYVTDVGMCGPRDGVIGMDRDIVLQRFRTALPARFEVAGGPSVICGVELDVERLSGRATRIQRWDQTT